MKNEKIKNRSCYKAYAANAFAVRLSFCLLLLLGVCPLSAVEYADSAVYQGMMIKLDLGNSVFELARSGAKQQSYEIQLNWDLQHRFFPTFEAGYARAIDRENDTEVFSGQGGFAKIGLDIATIKKNREHYQLLVGVRAGTSANHFDLTNHALYDTEGQFIGNQSYTGIWRADAWGEVCASINVNVAGAFYMGWAVRLKFLFTKKPYHLGEENEIPRAYYIPGYGYDEDSQFGLNYYIGFKF